MEFGSIEREIHIAATPETVFDVISDPGHVRQWWPDEAEYEVRPGSAGTVTFTNPAGEKVLETIQVVETIPHRLFSFRWTQPLGEQAAADNSFLVTFSLEPSGGGTLLRMSETGFRERGWEAAVLEAAYQDHVRGWDHFLPRLHQYAQRVGADA